MNQNRIRFAYVAAICALIVGCTTYQKYVTSLKEKLQMSICANYTISLKYRSYIASRGVNPDNPIIDRERGITEDVIAKMNLATTNFSLYMKQYHDLYGEYYNASNECLGFPIDLIYRSIKME